MHHCQWLHLRALKLFQLRFTVLLSVFEPLCAKDALLFSREANLKSMSSPKHPPTYRNPLVVSHGFRKKNHSIQTLISLCNVLSNILWFLPEYLLELDCCWTPGTYQMVVAIWCCWFMIKFYVLFSCENKRPDASSGCQQQQEGRGRKCMM